MLLCIIWAGGCREKDPDGVFSNTKWETVRIAIIMPYNESQDYTDRYHRTAKWFLDTFHSSQKSLQRGIKIAIDWYDESAEDMKALGEKLAADKRVAAVVGPEYSVDLDIFAAAYAISGKPLLAPVASSEEVIRRYSTAQAGTMKKSPFLWSLTETDISQSEVLLSIVTSVGGRSIALLSSDDTYGTTYANWIPFLAHELGLEVKTMLKYSDQASLEAVLPQFMRSGADFGICALGSSHDVLYLAGQRKHYGDKIPHLLFSDTSMNVDLMGMEQDGEGIEGVSMYADPSSGFELSYTERFGVPPNSVEAHFYDALMLVGLAAFHMQHAGGKDLNESIRAVTSPHEGRSLTAWNLMGMQAYLKTLEDEGTLTDMRGATGAIRFDRDALSSVLHTTSAQWLIHDGTVVTLDYASSDGSKRTEGTMASWNWRAQMEQEIEDREAEVSFGELKDKWALLVAGSKGWKNYRHQADVLNVYQALKRCGWDDDHIVLIMQDDIAYNEKNLYPGVISSYPGGPNLYAEVDLDYCADTLEVADIRDIITGQRSAHLPRVLDTDEGSDILVYWTGHGEPGYFCWMDDSVGFSAEHLHLGLSELAQMNSYRKILLCAEPCYSASVVKATEGLKGILGIASASDTEYSFADNYSVEQGVWMSDRFTNNLINALSENRNLTYKELYSYLVSHTLGSHVGVFNAALFGNLYREAPAEFFVYNLNL